MERSASAPRIASPSGAPASESAYGSVNCPAPSTERRRFAQDPRKDVPGFVPAPSSRCAFPKSALPDLGVQAEGAFIEAND